MLGDIMKIGGVLGAVALMLPACAGSVPEREAMSAPYAGDQGGAGELLFAFSGSESHDDPRNSPDYARADGRLNIRLDGPRLAQAQWPEAERSSLENARSVFIRDRDDRFTYFGPERRVQRRSYRWDGR